MRLFPLARMNITYAIIPDFLQLGHSGRLAQRHGWHRSSGRPPPFCDYQSQGLAGLCPISPRPHGRTRRVRKGKQVSGEGTIQALLSGERIWLNLSERQTVVRINTAIPTAVDRLMTVPQHLSQLQRKSEQLIVPDVVATKTRGVCGSNQKAEEESGTNLSRTSEKSNCRVVEIVRAVYATV